MHRQSQRVFQYPEIPISPCLCFPFFNADTHLLLSLPFLCVTPCIHSRDAGRTKLSFPTQEPIPAGQALKLPNVTKVNRVILICSNGRQRQVLPFLGSLQLWLKAVNEMAYSTCSELTLLLD